ncbi:hypothetical protein ODJ79_16735 [Actinoplanes sp. KI2]|uniref:hypothetical protein n=1 Tax=Actinoplanes sp. KI2 TaxID=2983315 RepID=UPI0021D5DD04|nr:hypothetical protein [Actinoplanes sp. KI2]MCU7725374.1 hypothetical protein [Actinoplanes sp. KI2]
MRHIRSILYSLVLAPAAWVLTAVGLTGDLTARGRDGFAVENFTGLLLLLLAGAAYGILVLGPFSPAGPLLAGVVYLALSAWALTAPSAYADIWPPAVVKEGFDLSRPGYGLAAILAVPLICTALSARRWAKYEPPVLPLIGPIGRAHGAAPAYGMPLSIAQTTVIGVGHGVTDPDPTTALRLPSADSTTAVVPGAAMVPGATVPGAAMVPGPAMVSGLAMVSAPAAVSGPVVDEDPTIAWAMPKALATVAAADEDTVASTPTPPAEEPITVVDVSPGEPTITLDEEPTETVATAESVADEVTEPAADEEPTTTVVASEADEVPEAEPVEDDEPTKPTAAADQEPETVVAPAADAPAADAPAADAPADEEPTAKAGEGDEGEGEGDADEGDADGSEAEEDDSTVASPVAGADRTEVIRLPMADNGDKTQVVRLPAADNGERTQVVRLPVAEVVPFPTADPEEKTRVIRLPQVLQFPVRSPDAEPGQRTRDLSNRATGDVGGDETQVIRLAGKAVDDEKTQVIRPALVTRPDDRGDVLAFRAPTLRDATPPPPTDPEPSIPTETAPTDATPTPKPTEATPTDAAPTDAAPTDAAPTDAAPTDAAPTDAAPAPTEATPTDAAPTPTGTTPAVNAKVPTSIADAEAANFADDPTSPLTLSLLNGDEAAETHSRSMTVMKMERPPDDPADETTRVEIVAQRRPSAEE